MAKASFQKQWFEKVCGISLKSPTIRAVVRLAQALKVKPSLIVERMERLLAGAGQDKEKTARRRPTKAPS